MAVAAAPLAVVGTHFVLPLSAVAILLMSIACCTLLIYVLAVKEIVVPQSALLVLILIFGPFVLGLLVGVPAAMLASPMGLDYSGYVELATGRLINGLALATFFIGTLTLVATNKRNSEGVNFAHFVTWVYWIATGIFVVVAVWQILHFYLGFGYPLPETRTHVHGVPLHIRDLVPGRVTGLAKEPSFLVPFVIDFALLSILFARGTRLLILLVVSSCVVLFSFSLGGYLNVWTVVTVGAVLMLFKTIASQKINRKSFVAVSILGTATAILLTGLAPFLEVVGARIGGALHPESYARSFMVVMPFYWMADGNVLNILFGHGPKSYAMLGEMMLLPSSGQPVHATSNNWFVDSLWEHGVFGFLGAMTLLFILARRTRVFSRGGKERVVALLFVVHLFTSSLYRGDFFSLRFFVVLLIIVFLIEGFVSVRKMETG